MHIGIHRMSLGGRALALLPLSLFLSYGGLSGCNTRTYNSTPKLIGGKEAELGEFPGVIQINRSCTASLVGKRHILTAGHCVSNLPPGKLPVIRMKKGDKIRIDTGVEEGKSQTTKIIESVVVHPSFLKLDLAQNDLGSVTDLAVISLQSEFTGVPPVKMDFSAIQVNDSIVMVGFGCESESAGLFGIRGKHKLKTGERTVVAVGPLTYSTHRNQGKEEVQGCQGDSGGPVFSRPGGKLTVKGVNSFTEGSSASAFVRLDVGAESWLKGNVPDLEVAYATGSTPPAYVAPPAPPAPSKPKIANALGTGSWDSLQIRSCSYIAGELGITTNTWKADEDCYVRLRSTADLIEVDLFHESTHTRYGTSSPDVTHTKNGTTFVFKGLNAGQWQLEIDAQASVRGSLKVIDSPYIDYLKRNKDEPTPSK